MEAAENKEEALQWKAKVISEAGLATAHVQDSLTLLTSVFKMLAIEQIESA
jgi:hypothetical protein